MKKLFFAAAVLFGSFSMYSCDNQAGTESDANETVIDSETKVSEYEVEETVVETDTTTRTETIDADETRNQ
ncbi:hypothetical protein FVR03_04540 [Pontibacter qinzhouensis]|uniref:Uncharacterized protein n=1 Tax=Pontibacter qinzhouensis TaxID=2603253 RepID=A0A5C8K9A2_9BACT|nr:hypothetical protein [Pontibacter qinzhouensis]TXK50763.1 hypothetical protein FVR03_04540 [Pontibacter qinzhouensis]